MDVNWLVDKEIESFNSHLKFWEMLVLENKTITQL
jgi:hypothetical protein